MDNHDDRTELTRELAAALWRSASRSYGRTLGHWLAAEQMVAQSLRYARVATLPNGIDRPSGTSRAKRPKQSLPSQAFPVDLDIWLRAETEILTEMVDPAGGGTRRGPAASLGGGLHGRGVLCASTVGDT